MRLGVIILIISLTLLSNFYFTKLNIQNNYKNWILYIKFNVIKSYTYLSYGKYLFKNLKLLIVWTPSYMRRIYFKYK